MTQPTWEPEVKAVDNFITICTQSARFLGVSFQWSVGFGMHYLALSFFDLPRVVDNY